MRLLFHRRRQLVVGEVHVDVLRVAAVARQRHRIEDRRLGRGRVVRMVGVEGLARDHPPRAEKFLVGDVVHLRKAGDVQLLLVVRLELAEHLHRLLEIRRLVFLLADHQHMVLGPGAVERRLGLGIDRLRQVDARDLGPGVIGQRGDRIGHRDFLRRAGRCQKRRPIAPGNQIGESNRKTRIEPRRRSVRQHGHVAFWSEANVALDCPDRDLSRLWTGHRRPVAAMAGAMASVAPAGSRPSVPDAARRA